MALVPAYREVVTADLAALAMDVLTGERHAPSTALDVVPRSPGLYAIYGSLQAWRDLDLDDAGLARALYVGKAEHSLVGRDVRTHFATGRTGSSTLRRSLAALLRNRLSLIPVPRNLDKPDGSANYGLESEGDQRLTDWMHEHLTLGSVAEVERPGAGGSTARRVPAPREPGAARVTRRPAGHHATATPPTAKPRRTARHPFRVGPQEVQNQPLEIVAFVALVQGCLPQVPEHLME